jgi:hypothetical protein
MEANKALAKAEVSSTPNTSYELIGHSQSVDILTIETYLAQEKAPRPVQDAFERVKKTYCHELNQSVYEL